MEAIDKKVFPGDHNVLRLNWPVQQAMNYGVRINFEDESRQNEVKYIVRVTRLKPTATGEPLFQIERIGDVFINEGLPDLVADRLAYTAGKVFYPLIITVDNNGGFASVFNHQDILKRWVKIKTDILDNFEGKLVEDYIANMEKQLAVRERIHMALFYNDWFLQTFFKPIYKTYGANQHTESIYNFPILKGLMADGYLTKEKLSPNVNDFGAIELLHEGEVKPDADDVIAALMPSGTYNGYYALHPGFKHIISIVSDFTYDDKETADVKVKIFMIPNNGEEFDHDFTHGKAGVSQNGQSGLVIVDGSPKKSFWDRLLNI